MSQCRIDTPDPLWDPEQQIAALREQITRLEGEQKGLMLRIDQLNDADKKSYQLCCELATKLGKEHGENVPLATRCRELEARYCWLPISAEMNWYPIETAPKDGTWVLCAWKNSAERYGIPTPLYWHGECWTNIDPALTPVVQNALKPTHWMPLGEPK